MRTLTPLLALTLIACSETSHDFQSGALVEEAAVSFAAAPQADMVVSSARMKRDVPASNGGEVEAVAGDYLAYRYGYSFSLPASSVKATVNSHAQTCLEAGPSLCQVLNTSTRDFDADNVSANLSLRAEPEWLETYAKSLIKSVEDASGRMTASNVSAEDLTRQILDVDARLSAQKTLRDRLTGLLETRDAKLPDLLALERELARVQAEIESATSRLKALRQRVSMSVVDINYSSQSRAVSRSAFAPIMDAIKDFVGVVSQGFANVIRFIALILPWLLFLILPVLLILRWMWRRRASRKAES